MLVLDTSHLLADSATTVSDTAAPQLDVQGIALVVGVLVPLAVAAITKRWSAPIVKSATNIVLVVVGAVLTVLADSGPHTWLSYINAIIQAFVASVAAYKGLWKPLQVNSKLAPGVGIGGDTRPVGGTASYRTGE